MKTGVGLFLILVVSFATGCTKVKLQEEQHLSKLSLGRFVPDPDTVTVRVRNYCPAAGRTYKDIFVSNYSVEVYNGQNQFDADKDGVPDTLEIQYSERLNLSPALADSNGDSFSDLFIYLSGISVDEQMRLRCIDQTATDGTDIWYTDPTVVGATPVLLGLRNCEKQMMHLDTQRFDTVGDGVPDYLKTRCGMNPQDAVSASIDTDGDGINNYEECKRHTPINETNGVGGIQKLEYKYVQEGQTIDGQRCYDFTISNISVLNKGRDNLIAIFITESEGNQQVPHIYKASLVLPDNSVNTTFELQFDTSVNGSFSGT